MFAEETGRLPLDEHELSSWVARAAQPRPNSVAGFDSTFTPVERVSVLWGLSEPEDAAVIEAGHRAAIGEVVEFLENEVVFTRRGAGGVRQIERPTTTPNASISTRRTSRPPTTSHRESGGYRPGETALQRTVLGFAGVPRLDRRQGQETLFRQVQPVQPHQRRRTRLCHRGPRREPVPGTDRADPALPAVDGRPRHPGARRNHV
ncbi:relaxase domain-containing protein [Nocardia rhamnosiphila]|uniref:relaxase domain-containing protein n=1 Tax=Nocardia rhamnosiphila TaxID=426716 RepID=UPI0035A25EE1